MVPDETPHRYRVGMHVPTTTSDIFDLWWYWSDSIPDICAMAEMVPGIEDIMAFDCTQHRFAAVGDEWP